LTVSVNKGFALSGDCPDRRNNAPFVLKTCFTLTLLAGTVAGAVAIEPQIAITVEGAHRFVRSNGIPNHETGRFPNRGNPNAVRSQSFTFRMAAHPVAASRPTPSGPAFFGVALNGVPFEAGTAEFWKRDCRSGWNYEVRSEKVDLGLDQNDAHVQPTGAYHYHALPDPLPKALGDDGSRMVQVGWAADGFPICTAFGHDDVKDPKDPKSKVRKMKSSCRLKAGLRPNGPRGTYEGTFTEDYEYVAGLGDVDECNGRVSVTAEFSDGIYCYFLTEDFPYIARQWRGAPDVTFLNKGNPNARRDPGGGPGRRGVGFRPPRR
jgi:hypothetical protein